MTRERTMTKKLVKSLWEKGGGITTSCAAVVHMTIYPGGGVNQFVHGRSRMAIDPRLPTTPGRSMLGFHQPGRHCLHQARSAVGCSASRMKGELHPCKNSS